MIKLKKATVLTISALLLSGSFSAVNVQADELDDKIASQNQKIDQLEQNQNDAASQLSQLENEVAAIEADYNSVLEQKTNEEKHLNELTQKIDHLKLVIRKRTAKLEKQARNVQTENTTSSILTTVLEAKSFNEAVEKTMAAKKLMSASKDIMDQQKKDKQELETLQIEAQGRLASISQKTDELKEKQETLAKAKLDQQVKINEISASLATEKDEKAKFIQQKEEAERKRQEALKALEEQRAREAKAQAEAKAAAQKAEEQAQADAAKKAEQAAKEQAEAEKAQAEAQKAAEQAQADAAKKAEQAAAQQQAAEQAKEAEQAEANKKAEEAQNAADLAAQQAAEAQKAEQLAADEQAAAQKAQAEAAAQAEAEAAAQQQAQQTVPTAQDAVAAAPAAPQTTSSGWTAPLATGLSVTSPFGYRSNPTGIGSEHHDGIDFAGTDGTPVMAAKEGTVVESGFHYSAGNHVVIQHPDGHYSYYMHFNSAPAVSVGQTVSAGQVIGAMGTSGNSTGTHLHFGVSTALWSAFVDPAPLLGI